MTAAEKARELVSYFKRLVYPFTGSSMLTNDEDEGVILSNSKTCAKKVAEQQIESWSAYAGKYIHNLFDSEVRYWKDVKAEIENL